MTAVIVVKRVVAAIICALLLMVFASGEGIIVQDFYLNDRMFATFREKTSILPNTLRLSLVEGESDELWAEVMPYVEMSENLSWRLCENSGAVEIYPKGKTCAVYAKREGRDVVRISLGDECSSEVEVCVERGREVKVRSFETEEEESPSLRAENFIRIMIAGLVFFSTVILGGVCFSIIRRKR